nr:hypothetical protein [Achromobacter xylosoxidans]
MARASVGAGLPAPGHPSARLCAEEPQAGIQARGLRTVFGHAGPHPRRRGARADDGARAVVRAGRAGRGRSGPVARAERAVPPLRLRRGAGPVGRRHGRPAGAQRAAQGGPQRSVPVRQRQEVQAVPRQAGLSG